ncbi:MAG: T9SS type A sorting domain-containing protein [Ferruginibacter sp.]
MKKIPTQPGLYSFRYLANNCCKHFYTALLLMLTVAAVIPANAQTLTVLDESFDNQGAVLTRNSSSASGTQSSYSWVSSKLYTTGSGNTDPAYSTTDFGYIEFSGSAGVSYIQMPDIGMYNGGTVSFWVAAGSSSKKVKLQSYNGAAWVDEGAEITIAASKTIYQADRTITGTGYQLKRFRILQTSSASCGLLRIEVKTFANDPYAISFTTPAGCNTGELTITWSGPPAGYNAGTNTLLAFLKPGSAVTKGTPSGNVSTYTASTDLSAPGTSYQNDAAARCIYKGDGINAAGDHDGLTITGLAAGTIYHLLVYNVTDASSGYTAGAVANGTTLSSTGEPLNNPTGFAKGTVTTSNIPLSWTAATGTPAPAGYLISASNSGSPGDPGDFSDPADQTDIAGGTANVKTSGTGYSSFTGFDPGTMYYFRINSYTNSGPCINFKTAGPAFNTATLPNAATAPSMSIITGTGTITWTAGSGYNNSNHNTLVFVSSSAIAVNTPTVNPGGYGTSTAFGSGAPYQGDGNARCVYNGDGTSATVTGLSAGTTYYVLILTAMSSPNSDGTYTYSAYTTTSTLAASEYTWNGGASSSWATATNWTPNRNTRLTTDVLIFNTPGNVTATNVIGETIAKLLVSAGNVTLEAPSAVTLAFTSNNGALNGDLVISIGTSLTMSTVNITLNANSSADINGTLTVNASRTYNTNNAGSVTNVYGILYNSGAVTSTNAARMVVYNDGVYTHNINGGVIPTATWNFNSTCLITGVVAADQFSSGSHAQTFSKFVWDCAAQNSAKGSSPEGRFVLGAGINAAGPYMIITDSFIVKRTNGIILQLSSSGGQRDFTCGNYYQYGGRVAITYDTEASGEQRSLTVNNTFYLTDSLEAITKFQIINNPSSQDIIGRLFVKGDIEMHPTLSAAIIERVVGGANALAEIWFNGNIAQWARFHTISGNIDFVTSQTGPGVTLLSNATANLFKLLEGTFYIGSNTLTIKSNVLYPPPGTGTIGGSSTSNLVLQGIAGTLNFYDGSRVLKDFILETNATASLGTELSITAGVAPGRDSLGTGSVLTTNDNLILRSDNFGTARMARVPVDGSGLPLATINGKVAVERYLPMGTTYDSRRWRLLTAPFRETNSPTISQAWQEGAVSTNRLDPAASDPKPGYGTHITVSTVAVNGFDQGVQNNPSIFRHNNAGNTWQAPPNTTSTKITDNGGVYMLFARGDRSIVIVDQFVDAKPTTLDPKGELNLGNVSKSLVASGYQAVGNPYASAIKLDNVLFNDTPGSRKFIYIWDPKVMGTNGVGKFITCQGDGNSPATYTYTGNASNYGDAPGIIESSGAFMVKGNGGNIIFHESDKVFSSTTIGMASRPQRPLVPVTNFGKLLKLYTDMYVIKNDIPVLADAVAAVFNNNYKNIVDDMDAVKPVTFNTREQLGIRRADMLFSIERRKEPLPEGDTVFLYLSRLNQAAYQFGFRPEQFGSDYTAYLKDNFLHTYTAVHLQENSTYNFQVTTDAGSSATNRFYIVFHKKPKEKPVTLKASLTGDDIAVEWNKPGYDLKPFYLERSVNGTDFSAIAKFTAGSQQEDFKWTDLAPAPGEYTYRLQYANNEGTLLFSNIAAITKHAGRTAFVYPNPVYNNQINMQLSHLPAGNYTARLINIAGQQIHREMITSNGTAATKTIRINKPVAGGMYTLEIRDAGKIITTTSVLLK